MPKLGIIGAGPAGMVAALEARKAGVDVLLFDSNDILGRKLLVTGSGRCNLTNALAAPGKYHASSQVVLQSVFNQFGHQDLVQYLHKMGIITHATADGWFYPLSNSAVNVAAIFAAHLQDAGVEIHLAHQVDQIIPQKKGFLLKFVTGQSTLFVDSLLVAVGGKAYPTLGSDGSIFPALQQLGHQILPVQPALAPLVVPQKAFQAIQGVRADVGVRLFSKNMLLGETVGNIIFTKGGINGPGVMDLSYLVSLNPKQALGLEINFLPTHAAELDQLMQTYASSAMPVQSLLGAVVAPKIVEFVLRSLHIPTSQNIRDLRDSDRKRILDFMTAVKVKVEGVRGFDFCQLSTGGIALEDVQPDSLESRILKGLYFAGEILDVNGPCGGYNLQWAFSSGIVAGRSAAKALLAQ
jgi:predicted Rossmann fold flavoprotein